jgi:hypothetical protein
VASSTLLRVTEQIGFLYGLGVAILFLGATALGRLSVIGADRRQAGRDAPPDHARGTGRGGDHHGPLTGLPTARTGVGRADLCAQE